MKDYLSIRGLLSLAVGCAALLSGCVGSESEAVPETEDGRPLPVQEGLDPSVAPTLADDPALASQGIPVWDRIQEPWFGDLDGMVERRVIRAGVVPSKTMFFLDGAKPRGATFDALTFFENELNETLNRGDLKVHVVLIPMSRDQLFPALLEGRVDIAAANLTITPERLESVDFADPLLRNVTEVLVTGPEVPPLEKRSDLGGQTIHIRPSSSFYQTLLRLNETLREEGKAPIQIQDASEFLESEDLLEMVNAGVVPATVVDGHIADFWAQVFPDIQVHTEVPVKEGGAVSWAFRRESPQLKATLNGFVKGHRQGTLLGNMTLRRYLADADYVVNPTEGESKTRFEAALPVFRRYGGELGFDPLMLIALAYQESGLDQNARSQVGAQGIMQLMPATAADPNVGIPDISSLEANVHAGTKYLRFLVDRYFSDEPMDGLNEHLFGFAAYNAGPARIAQLRSEAAELGLDPNLWFRNVELVAARRIGRETVQYVGKIYKYYLAYAHMEELQETGGQAP